jgi:hypothetical protein
VVPVRVTVPRRQYVDFHDELFPPVLSPHYALSAQKWIEGDDATRETMTLTPNMDWSTTSGQNVGATAPRADNKVPNQESSSTQTPIPLTKPSALASDLSPTTSTAVESQGRSQVARQPAAAPPSSARALDARNTSQPKPSPRQTIAAGPKPRWSRKFLAGKKPLKADYEGFSGECTVLSPDAPLIKVRFLTVTSWGQMLNVSAARRTRHICSSHWLVPVDRWAYMLSRRKVAYRPDFRRSAPALPFLVLSSTLSIGVGCLSRATMGKSGYSKYLVMVFPKGTETAPQ